MFFPNDSLFKIQYKIYYVPLYIYEAVHWKYCGKKRTSCVLIHWICSNNAPPPEYCIIWYNIIKVFILTAKRSFFLLLYIIIYYMYIVYFYDAFRAKSTFSFVPTICGQQRITNFCHCMWWFRFFFIIYIFFSSPSFLGINSVLRGIMFFRFLRQAKLYRFGD